VRLLVVGGSSFIGRNLLEELSEGGHQFSEVMATYLNDTSFPTWAKSLGIKTIQYDVISDKKSWDKYDVCVYLAGNSNHSLAIRDPLKDLSMNAIGLLNFLRTFHGHIVYMSSAAVYYGLKGYVDVHTKLNPVFTYGISKLTCEHYIKAAYHSHNLTSYVIFRLFYAYGKYDKPRRLIPQVVKALLLDQRSGFSVVGTGQSFMDPLFAGYVAKVLTIAASKTDVIDTFDLCGGNNQIITQVVKDIGRALGKDITVSFDGTTETFPLEFYSSPERTIKVLGISSPPPFEEGVKTYARWAIREFGDNNAS